MHFKSYNQKTNRLNKIFKKIFLMDQTGQAVDLNVLLDSKLKVITLRCKGNVL
jgi:hypothetical protein